MSHKLNRREFIRGLGSASLMLPILPSLFPTTGFSQTTGSPLRFIFIMSPNGQQEVNFFPQSGTPKPLDANTYSLDLTSLSGPISPILGSSFNALKSKVTVLRGLDNICGDKATHGASNFLCGGYRVDMSEGGVGDPPRVGASIDWIIEQSNQFYSSNPKVRAMRFNSYGREFSFSNINGTKAKLPYLSTDIGLFNDVFSGVLGGGGSTTTVSRDQRKAFLFDGVVKRLDLLSKNPRLSSLDKYRLQQQTSDILSLKSGLLLSTPPTPAQCSPPNLAAYKTSDQRRVLFQNVFDTIVSAFVCDKTRIACVNIEDFDDVNLDYSYFHGISHANPDDDPWAVQESAKTNGWIADRVAYLLNKLNSVIDADGKPLLDNTIVVWGNEISNFWHRNESIPTVVAGGGAKGKLKTGVYLDYRTRPFKNYANRGDFPAVGRPYTQFLCSLMMAAGIPSSVYSQYGENGYFGEFVKGEYYNHEYDSYITQRNAPLPYFYIG